MSSERLSRAARAKGIGQSLSQTVGGAVDGTFDGIDQQLSHFQRWRALRALWHYRSTWRMAMPRKVMRAERDTQLAEIMPLVLLIALIAGMGLFVLLPTTLPEQAGDMLALAWPIWVAQAAPMTAALTLAVLSAPALALDLSGRHASGELAALPAGYAQPAGYPCMPWIVALSAACTAAAVLLVLFSLLFGLLASLVMNVGDVSADARLVLAAASPLKWLRLVASSALLGLVCGLSAVLYAWPGTQDAQTPASAHRLTLRVMLVSSLACVGTGLAINWVAALFGWNN